MAAGNNVRVGDADRENVAAQLREHYADGRLTFDELNERLDQTFAAKTKDDLTTVMRDLPQRSAPTAGAGSGSSWQGPGWQGQAWQGPGGQAWPRPMVTRSDQSYGRDGWDNQWDRGCGRSRGAFAPLMGVVWLLVIFGSLTLFGLGGDKPIIIVIFLAALALVRRLFSLGRRRSVRSRRGPRGGRGYGRW
jgi:hypothetical protein